MKISATKIISAGLLTCSFLCQQYADAAVSVRSFGGGFSSFRSGGSFGGSFRSSGSYSRGSSYSSRSSGGGEEESSSSSWLPFYVLAMMPHGENDDDGTIENDKRFRNIKVQSQNDAMIMDNRKNIYDDTGLSSGVVPSYIISNSWLYEVTFKDSISDNEIINKILTDKASYKNEDGVFVINYSKESYRNQINDLSTIKNRIKELPGSRAIMEKDIKNAEFIHPSVVTDNCVGDNDHSLVMQSKSGELTHKLRNCSILSSVSFKGQLYNGANNIVYALQNTYVKMPEKNSQGRIYITSLKNHSISVQIIPKDSESQHKSYYIMLSSVNFFDNIFQ